MGRKWDHLRSRRAHVQGVYGVNCSASGENKKSYKKVVSPDPSSPPDIVVPPPVLVESLGAVKDKSKPVVLYTIMPDILHWARLNQIKPD